MQERRITNIIKIMLFFLALAVFGVLALVLQRPTESQTEKRKLAAFPDFSFSGVWEGDYTSGIDAWYSDTMPNRDSLISFNNSLWSIKGFTIGDGEIHGPVIHGDDIPSDFPSDEQETTTKANQNGQTTKPSEPSESTTDIPVEGNDKGETINALFVYKNAAYSYYSFVKSVSNKYVKAVDYAAKALDGVATVYDIIIPLSTDITLPDSIRKGLDSSNQKSAIDYMYSGFTKAKTVNVYDALRQHRTEYLYFRTDHHWTALGAYYTYAEWAKVKGISHNDISSYETKTFDGFLGTLYSKTQSAALGNDPDTVIAYVPEGTNAMTFTDTKGQKCSWSVITDVTSWVSGSKYNTFIGGDNPFSVIQNDTITDGSACVVIKESFGNAFVPFLVDHYQYTYVIDYRYYNGDFYSFVKQNNVSDVIFINNISATSTAQRINEISAMVGYYGG